MVIVNPRSANNKTGKIWPLIKEQLDASIGSYAVCFTEKKNSAPLLTSDALEKGFERVVGIGGDGTFSEIVNGYFKNDKPINKKAVLSFISSGTGGDFRKTLGKPASLEEAIRNLSGDKIIEADVGKIVFKDFNSQNIQRYFINIASFGMGGETARRVNHIKFLKIFGGKTAFYLATLYTMFFYKNTLVKLECNGEIIEEKIRNIAVANGRFHGGGMMIAPEASINDGFFDVVILGDLNFLEITMLAGRIYKGTHLDHPKVKTLRTKEVRAFSAEKISIENDGEVYGTIPATFTVLPKILRLQV